MTIEALSAWLLSAMLSWNPPNEHREGAEAATRRYETIARDMATVALDANEKPLFAGQFGREQTALLATAVASVESGFRRDIDEGTTRGDNGRSWCLMQMHVFGRTAEGWTGPDLVAERTRCIRAGLRVMRTSFDRCRRSPFQDRLTAYVHGNCRYSGKASTLRVQRATGWWRKHPPPGAEGVFKPARYVSNDP